MGKKYNHAFHLEVKVKQTNGMRRQVAPWDFFCFLWSNGLIGFGPDFSAPREEPGEGVATLSPAGPP